MRTMRADPREHQPSPPARRAGGCALLSFAAALWVPALTAAQSPVTSGGPIPFTTLERGTYGEFREPVVVVARSVEDWDEAMRQFEQDGALWVVPGRPAPDSIEWGTEAVLLVGTGGGNADVLIRRLFRVAGRLGLEVDFPYLGLDPVEYSTYHLVKFAAWESLKSMACSGLAAGEALLAMTPHELPSPPARGRNRVGPGTLHPGLRITATPNPSVKRVELTGSASDPTDMLILSVDGRVVARLAGAGIGGGEARWSWDGRSPDGRPVPPGIYYARVATTRGNATVRLVRVR